MSSVGFGYDPAAAPESPRSRRNAARMAADAAKELALHPAISKRCSSATVARVSDVGREGEDPSG